MAYPKRLDGGLERKETMKGAESEILPVSWRLPRSIRHTEGEGEAGGLQEGQKLVELGVIARSSRVIRTSNYDNGWAWSIRGESFR
jgi:hypothetical protein